MTMASLLNLSPHSHSVFYSPPPTLCRSRSTILQSHHIHRCPSPPLQASKRVSNFRQDDPRNRSGIVIGEYDEDDEEDEDEDDEEDRSLDLLVKFVQNVFKKISRKARKAVRSVLPLNISTKLVGFSVNGVIILTFLWVLKAFLEVVCTLGTVVFVSILLIRGIWTGISYLQESRSFRKDEVDDDHLAWIRTQPVT